MRFTCGTKFDRAQDRIHATPQCVGPYRSVIPEPMEKFARSDILPGSRDAADAIIHKKPPKPCPEPTLKNNPHVSQPGLFFVIGSAVFLIGFNEFMLAPMLGALATGFGSSLVASSWLVSSYALSYALAAPLLGRWSDGRDRRTIVIGAVALLGLDSLALAFAPNLAVAVALRLLGGLASALLIPTALALIAESAQGSNQAAIMGRVMLGMTLGIVLGPAFAGSMTEFLGWRAVFGLVALASMGVALAAHLLRSA